MATPSAMPSAAVPSSGPCTGVRTSRRSTSPAGATSCGRGCPRIPSRERLLRNPPCRAQARRGCVLASRRRLARERPKTDSGRRPPEAGVAPASQRRVARRRARRAGTVPVLALVSALSRGDGLRHRRRGREASEPGRGWSSGTPVRRWRRADRKLGQRKTLPRGNGWCGLGASTASACQREARCWHAANDDVPSEFACETCTNARPRWNVTPSLLPPPDPQRPRTRRARRRGPVCAVGLVPGAAPQRSARARRAPCR